MCLVSAGARPRPNRTKRRPSGELFAVNVFYVFANSLLRPQMSGCCVITLRLTRSAEQPMGINHTYTWPQYRYYFSVESELKRMHSIYPAFCLQTRLSKTFAAAFSRVATVRKSPTVTQSRSKCEDCTAAATGRVTFGVLKRPPEPTLTEVRADHLKFI